jgi:hypothetical protein
VGASIEVMILLVLPSFKSVVGRPVDEMGVVMVLVKFTEGCERNHVMVMLKT